MLWQKGSDHLDLRPAEEAAEARRLWQEETRKTEEAWLAAFELNYLRGGRMVRFWANAYAPPHGKRQSNDGGAGMSAAS